jgi:hypothetical protein
MILGISLIIAAFCNLLITDKMPFQKIKMTNKKAFIFDLDVCRCKILFKLGKKIANELNIDFNFITNF